MRKFFIYIYKLAKLARQSQPGSPNLRSLRKCVCVRVCIHIHTYITKLRPYAISRSIIYIKEDVLKLVDYRNNKAC